MKIQIGEVFSNRLKENIPVVIDSKDPEVLKKLQEASGIAIQNFTKKSEKSYAVTRGGYKIKHIDLSPVYKAIREKQNEYMTLNKIKTLIIDGELMPWSALGEGLIKTQYAVVEKGLETELAFLKETNFEDHLKNLETKMLATDFEKDSKSFSKNQMIEKYGQGGYSTYKNFIIFKNAYIPLQEQENYLKVYKDQLKLYAQDGDLHFKPFALLKEIYEDGSEKTFFDETNETNFKRVSEDEYIVINLDDPEALKKATDFFNRLTTELKYEGVVVKPNDKVYLPRIAPYRKVRNKDYLTIIYGYDYTHSKKYDKHLRNKKIGKKMSLSISEFELGKKMLETKMSDISLENKEYMKLVTKMVIEERHEKGVDPRL